MKKGIALLAAALLLFCGCQREPRFDFLELNARLRSEDRAFGFPEKEVFRADGAYYVYYSFQAPHDVLLTMHADDDRLLDRVSAAIAADHADAAADFVALCFTLARVFIPSCNETELQAALRPQTDALFRESMRVYEQGRYVAVWYASESGACFFIDCRDPDPQEHEEPF